MQNNLRSAAQRLRAGFGLIRDRARSRGIDIRPDEWPGRSLLTPRCGLGSASVEVAERTLDVLAQTADILRRG